MPGTITQSENGSMMFAGVDAVAIYRAKVIASGLKLYAKTGMKPNRAYTPKAMMATAEQITGQKFKARDYMGAYDALIAWADAARAAMDAENIRIKAGGAS